MCRKELRFAYEKKDKELQEKIAQIQQLQTQVVGMVAVANDSLPHLQRPNSLMRWQRRSWSRTQN